MLEEEEEEDAAVNPSTDRGKNLLRRKGRFVQRQSPSVSILQSPLYECRQQRKVYVPRASSGGRALNGMFLGTVAKKIYQRGSKLKKTRRNI